MKLDSKGLSILRLKFPERNLDIMEVLIDENNTQTVTFAHIQRIFGVTRQTVSGWDRKGLEQSDISQPKLKLYDIDYVRKWHKDNIDQKHSARSSKNRKVQPQEEEDNPFAHLELDKVPQVEASRRKEIESVKKLITQNKLLDGESIDIEDVDRNMATQAATHISHLTNSEKILPDLLENKSASDMQEILNEHNQMSIEQLHRLTNKEISGEHELYDVFQMVLQKYDDGVDIETIMIGVDKIVIP